MSLKNQIKIKNKKVSIIILLYFLIGITVIPITISIQKDYYLSALKDVPESRLNTQGLGEGLIHDKVHTFHKNQRDIILSPYLLNRSFYHIKFAIVTDSHECHMNITLLDPNGLIYYIFKSEVPMRFNAYYTVPYGVTINGNHTIIFTETEGPNLNIHISIFQGDEMSDIPFPVQPKENYNCSLYLESDTMYKFFIRRVNPIAYGLDDTLQINLNLTAPNGIIFNIFNSKPITAFNSPIDFPFGTAMEGFYTMDFRNYQAQPNINILVHIDRIRKISTELNSSDIGNETNNNTSSIKALPYIPPAAFYGGAGIMGMVAIIALVIGYTYKKKFNN